MDRVESWWERGSADSAETGKAPARNWWKRPATSLSRDERRTLLSAQVAATRPAVTGVLVSGAIILGLTGLFEAFGLAPGIGYPWWLLELVAFATAAIGVATLQMKDWRLRLILILASTVALGVFLSVPIPGVSGQLAIRTGLFQLIPIALLALLPRRISMLAMVLVMLGLAYARIRLHGSPATGATLYWLFTINTVAFGLLLARFRADFAVAAFRLRRRLWSQASTDELTGLLNRSGWNHEAADAYSVATRNGHAVSFAFLDIDHFKSVNDSHGHDVGDQVLATLGRLVKTRLSPSVFGARFGGEEFVVLFVGAAPESVVDLVQSIRREFAREALPFGTTVSAGVAHRQADESMGQHLRRADIGLYEAKASGRNRLVVNHA